MIADLLDERGEETAREIGAAAEYVHLDVTSADSWSEVVEGLRSRYGRLHALVNNAGINRSARLEDVTEADFRAVVEVNQVGTFLGISHALPLLQAAGGASIVNMSSIAGLTGLTGTFSYAATKFAIRGMTKVAAVELGRYGIRVNSIHPGFFKTELTAAGGGGRSDLDKDAVGASLPLGRAGIEDDVAQMVAFLVSDDSAYSTGAEFVVDGGALAGLSI